MPHINRASRSPITTRHPISKHQHQHHPFFINFISNQCNPNRFRLLSKSSARHFAEYLHSSRRRVAIHYKGRRLRRRETRSGCCTCSASSLGICGATTTTPESHPFCGCSRLARRRRASSRPRGGVTSTPMSACHSPTFTPSLEIPLAPRESRGGRHPDLHPALMYRAFHDLKCRSQRATLRWRLLHSSPESSPRQLHRCVCRLSRSILGNREKLLGNGGQQPTGCH